ncbi:MAG TPA: glycosyltransferase family 4 protein [Solirubrobacteraceae bacterium]
MIGPLPPPIMGPSLYTRTLCEALEAAGAAVVHVNTQDRRSVFNTGILDVKNLVLGLVHVLQTGWRARRRAVRVVYVPISQNRWGYLRDAALIAAARALRRPVVAHLHGANFQAYYGAAPAAERWIVRRSLGACARVLALTPGLRGVYAGIVEPARVGVLENAIEDPWPQGAEALIAARAARPATRLLFVANDFAVKGAANLVRAMADPALDGTTLKMVGAPPAEVAAATRALAAELGIGHRVELCGEVAGAALTALYEWADLFVYPTENDGQPLVVLEAMAAGLPIVTSTFGGVPDTVGDTAVLVAPKAPEQTTEAVRRLLGDAAERQRLGRAARRRYEAEYTVEGFRRRVREVFGPFLEAPAG